MTQRGTFKSKFKENWRSSFLAIQGVVELVDMNWLEQFRLEDAGKEANDSEFNIISIEQLAQDIRWNGLNHTGVLEAVINSGNNTATVRMIAGNHRIDALRLLGHTHMPITVQLVIKRQEGISSTIGVTIPCNEFARESRFGLNFAAPSSMFPDVGINEC